MAGQPQRGQRQCHLQPAVAARLDIRRFGEADGQPHDVGTGGGREQTADQEQAQHAVPFCHWRGGVSRLDQKQNDR
ncbi:hypothetical protein D3C72_2519640 [compost metagenome]